MTGRLLYALEYGIADSTNNAEFSVFEMYRDAHDAATELQAAAHAVLTASDLPDVLAAHARLSAALAACGTVTATGEA